VTREHSDLPTLPAPPSEASPRLFDTDPTDVGTAYRQDGDGVTYVVTTAPDWTLDPQ